ncbi:MAG TPA: FHA domain-containing protein [Anaeromyxobacter sp.]|nr:FHA domain-containing protein [Anaeromyxobacter sp.]
MKLVIEDEVGTRSIVPFAAAELTVGRAPEGNDFRLPDRNVSRRHARFLNVNGLVSIEDLGSLTGTFVNGERISGRRRLRDGDLVEIGDYDLAVVPDEGLAVVAGPGAPPPLPGGARPPAPPTAAPAPPAPAAPAPVVASRPPPPRPAAPAPARARGSRWGFAAACLLSLLLGGAIGLAVGLATAPPVASAK